MDQRWRCAALALIFISVSALGCNASSGLPSLFATATFTATITPTPTLTPTATPTLRPTSTPKPPPIELLDQPDGSTLFIDNEGGYKILLPAFWTPLDITGSEIQDALANAKDDNPQLREVIKAAAGIDPDMFRLLAYSEEVSSYSYMTNLNIVMMRGGLPAGLPLDFLINTTVEGMKEQIPGVKIEIGEIKTNKNGVEIGMLELSNLSMKRPTGAATQIYEKQLYFKLDKAVIVITLATPTSSAGNVLPHFDALFDAISPIE